MPANLLLPYPKVNSVVLLRTVCTSSNNISSSEWLTMTGVRVVVTDHTVVNILKSLILLTEIATLLQK